MKDESEKTMDETARLGLIHPSAFF